MNLSVELPEASSPHFRTHLVTHQKLMDAVEEGFVDFITTPDYYSGSAPWKVMYCWNNGRRLLPLRGYIGVRERIIRIGQDFRMNPDQIDKMLEIFGLADES